MLLHCGGLANAWSQRDPLPKIQCQIHSPWGFPKASQKLNTICRQGYFVGYDAQAKIPAFVTYSLTTQHALGCVARSNGFATDRSVVNGATPEDYAGTGYDKGHMSPDGDLSWDQQVEFESFLMTNMSPQLPGLNRGTWKLLETSVRAWSIQLGQPFTIYVGNVYSDQDPRIGKGVIVPHAFYKIVINNKTLEVAGWWFPHREDLGADLTKLRMPVSEIIKKSGVEFKLPPRSKELPIGKEWPVNFGALTKSKQSQCHI